MTTTTLPIGDAKLALLNAPDITIGEKDAGTRAGQAFRIQLVQDLTKEMKDHLRHGKAQLVLGTNSHIRFGNNTFVPIVSQPETFRREVYAQDMDKHEGLMYRGLVSHTFAETKEREVVAQADAAMLQLNVTMANLQKEKEQNKAQSVNAIMPNNKKAVLVRQPAVSNKIGSRSSQSALSKGLTGLAHDPKSSPGSLGVQSGSVAMTTACRKVLVHLLAVKPLEAAEIVQRSCIPKITCMNVLQKIANPDQSSLKWKLTDKAYKELDPYDFRYEGEDRAVAIQSAIAAFDRQRISKDDKIWQKLLPESERGSGKILSKLNLTGPGSSTPIVPRPSTKSSSPTNESVSGILSADESRPQAKFGAAAEVRAKQIFNRKTIPKPSSSSSSSLRPNKPTTSEANGATAAVSDNDMAKKGVAQRVLKRKASETKFKSDERIDDSDVDDDSLVVKTISHELERKKPKTNEEGTETTRTERAKPIVPAKSKETTKQTTKPQTSTPAMKPKVTTTTVTGSPPTATTIKKTAAPVPSANGFFGAATSAPKIRKVTRVTGSTSDGEKQKSANTSNTTLGSAPRQHQRQKSQEQPQSQKKSDATEDEKLKPKQTTTNTVKGLAPSPNLPPRPPRSISSSNLATKSNNKLHTSSARLGQAARPRTNEGLAGSAHADKQTQKQTATDNAQLHKRIPSTSTISSSSTTSTVFTPPTHRNSTSSSLSSSSSMVFTRSDAKALKREREDDVKTEQPTTKKIKKSEVTRSEDSTNSSPLSELASVSTPSQSVVAARSPLPPPPASKAKTSINAASQVQRKVEQVNTQAQIVLVPTTTTEQPPANQVSAKRRRLASLRMQFYGLFTSWISARVAFHKDESNATDKTLDRLKAQHTKVKAMEVEIRNLMDEVEDFTMWDGVPAKFVTQHEDFLRERLRTLHPTYNEKWDELEKMREKEERGESYDELKKELCKRLEEIEDLQAILHPAQEWEFVDGTAAAVKSNQ